MEPQAISEDEAEWGFEKIPLRVGLGGFGEPEIVVARILSSSDILVRTVHPGGETLYSHQRWGYDKTRGEPRRFRWYAVHTPIPKDMVAGFIQEFDFNPPKEIFPGDFIPAPFM